MLTPQDIQDVKFVKSIKGYDKDQVDDFLDTVQSDYSALYKENATLKGKMRVLVDKIEEYRLVDEQMRKAFYSAQMTAQETVSKAQAEADMILRNARAEAETKVNDIRAQIDAEMLKLEEAKAESRRYAELIRNILVSEADVLEKLVKASAPSKKQNIRPESKSDEFAVDFSAQTQPEPEDVAGNDGNTKDLEDLGIKDAEGTERENETVAVGAGIDDSGRFNFTELRFGKNYKEDEE